MDWNKDQTKRIRSDGFLNDIRAPWSSINKRSFNEPLSECVNHSALVAVASDAEFMKSDAAFL